jgi:LmbE family N-acetylglucosaminyl deacetylase
MGHAQALDLHMPESEPCARLAALLDPQRSHVDAPEVGVIVAHPDDETIGCGAQLARWIGVIVVLVTDGAPADGNDARAAGFASTADYARARRRELETALEIAGVRGDALIALDIPDQQVAWRLVETTHRLMEIVATRRLSILITHAYEGGHPDHDGTAFAVHAAARLLECQGKTVLIAEMPYYRAADGGVALQTFTPEFDTKEYVLHLRPEQQVLKRRMIAAHRTQSAILAPFSIAQEQFRIAPFYDFRSLPNEGRLSYEQQDWGLTGREWMALARSALAKLRLDGQP